MAVPLLDLKAQHATIRDSVVNAMTKVIDEQAFILGEPVERLEREVALLSHTTHAIGCANGTDAILLALRALDIGRGDEVLTTPFTFFQPRAPFTTSALVRSSRTSIPTRSTSRP